MAKHEKEKYFSWDPPKDDFYKARIDTLEKANETLKLTVAHLERELARSEYADEQSDLVRKGIISEFENEIAELKAENDKLKRALIKAMIGD